MVVGGDLHQERPQQRPLAQVEGVPGQPAQQLAQALLAGVVRPAAAGGSGTRSSGTCRLLATNWTISPPRMPKVVRSDSWRATTAASALLEQRHVQRAGEAHRQAHVPGRRPCPPAAR